MDRDGGGGAPVRMLRDLVDCFRTRLVLTVTHDLVVTGGVVPDTISH